MLDLFKVERTFGMNVFRASDFNVAIVVVGNRAFHRNVRFPVVVVIVGNRTFTEMCGFPLW